MTQFENEILYRLSALIMAVKALAMNQARQMEHLSSAYSAEMIDDYVSTLESGGTIASYEEGVAP